jgi:hypothetical protein
MKEYYKKHPHKWTINHIRRRGVDPATVPPKPNTCKCCGRANRKLEIDHCHIGGNFRGWICGNCNRALGMVNDNIDDLKKLIVYLYEGLDVEVKVVLNTGKRGWP